MLPDDINPAAYGRPRVVAAYVRSEGLIPPERRVIAAYRAQIEGKAVLDLGCGAGRTTAAFAPLAARYDGVDYAPPMVAHCRAAFGHLSQAQFHVMDAASMSALPDAAYDFILFSFNGIDSVGHEKRLSVLREARRLSKPDAVFVFSSHNRAYAGIKRRPSPPSSASPRAWARFALATFHSLRNRRHEHECAEYAIVNDDANSFRLLLYYASLGATLAQVADAGFRVVEVLDMEGGPIAPNGDHPHVAFFTVVAVAS